jgi:hypothetical protein
MTATQPVNFIRFHGLTLLVVEHEGVEYIAARPIADLCGMDWKGAKRSLKSDDNAVLYGTRALLPPRIDGVGEASFPQTASREAIYIRLDRARMFLARVSTAQMRAQGNVSAADALLALQIEWAAALHAYETTGVAVKRGHHEALATALQLVKARAACADARERAVLTTMLHEVFAALGHPVPADAQPALPGM